MDNIDSSVNKCYSRVFYLIIKINTRVILFDRLSYRQIIWTAVVSVHYVGRRTVLKWPLLA